LGRSSDAGSAREEKFFPPANRFFMHRLDCVVWIKSSISLKTIRTPVRGHHFRPEWNLKQPLAKEHSSFLKTSVLQPHHRLQFKVMHRIG